MDVILINNVKLETVNALKALLMAVTSQIAIILLCIYLNPKQQNLKLCQLCFQLNLRLTVPRV